MNIELFREKMGENVPLKFVLFYDDMDVLFGDTIDLDVLLEYKLCILVMKDINDPNYVGEKDESFYFYDEIKMATSFKIRIED